MEFLKKRPNTDFHIEFEGETSFSNFLGRVLKDRKNELELFDTPVDGCVFIHPNKKKGLVKGSKPPRIQFLNDIPSPYLNGMLDNFFDGRLSPFIETNRGCPFKCSFCHYVFWHDPYRHRSAENVIAEIKQLMKKYNANFFNFWDELTFHKLGPAEKFVDEVIKADLKGHWTASIRADLMGRDVDNKGKPIPREKRLNLAKKFVKAGAAGVHFEDQLASEKKCGHMGGKVLVPTQTMIKNLKSARLSADIMKVPLIILARTDANAAKLITNDVDENDKPFLTGKRSPEGFYYVKEGLDQAISRGLAYAPYSDLIWCETAKPNLEEAKTFATAIHNKFPGKLLAYNCSPSFNWKKNLSDKEIEIFQKVIGKMGYKFQFITLAGFHAQNYAIFDLAKKYKQYGMTAYSRLQQQEFDSEKEGYTATKHQREVGTSYFDAISNAISSGESSTTAMKDSTETDQF